MKYFSAIFLIFIIFLSGCTKSSNMTNPPASTPTGVGVANPAAEKCIKDGYKHEIIETPQGQMGICVFSGSACEEWKYYRGECSPEICDVKCFWEPCPGKHLPNEKGCVNCASPCRDDFCRSNSDCSPAQCCHPDSCIIRTQAPDCEGVFCTQECRLGTMDCGAGYCACIEGRCEVKWV